MTKSKFLQTLCFAIICFSLFLITTNASAATLQINNTTLYYNQIIYVDAVKGNDTTGNGTQANPYASINKAVDNVTVDKTAIKIAPGVYRETIKTVPGSYNNQEASLMRPTPNMDYDLVGDPVNPPVVILTACAIDYRQMIISQLANTLTKAHTYRMFDLIFKVADGSHVMKVFCDLMACAINTVEIYNCVFDNANGKFDYLFVFNTGTYGTSRVDVKIYNSVLQGNYISYHNGAGYLTLTNCILQCTNGAYYAQGSFVPFKADQTVLYPHNYNYVYAFSNSAYLLNNPQLDATYHVTNPAYQHVGVGTNPDGTKSDLGVYGGPYAWNGSVVVDNPQMAKLAGGYGYSSVIINDQTLYSFGYNANGRLGIGSTTNQPAPVSIGSADWDKISSLWNHTVALKKNGTLWAWGANEYGQLGNGTTNEQCSPVQIGTATDWAQIAAGYQQTVALKKDGTLWAWGNNTYGQLGDGTNVDKLIPTQISTATDWQAVTTGSYHVVALKKDGSLWAWGDNRYYQLGDGTTLSKNIPTRIGSATDWAMVSAAGGHTLAIKSNGTLWGWGRQGYGELGDDTTVTRQAPTQIGTDSNWAAVAAIWNHTAALKKDGSLWTWGWNYYGQLGNGTMVDSYTPIRIGMATDWVAVSGGDAHTIAMKQDGSLYTWGFNSFGQLGNGTLLDSAIPVRIW